MDIFDSLRAGISFGKSERSKKFAFARPTPVVEQDVEATNQKKFDSFSDQSEYNKASLTKDLEHKTAKVKSEKKALVVKKADLEGTQKELDAALLYFDKLKPSCIDAGTSYEGRVARREDEGWLSMRSGTQL